MSFRSRMTKWHSFKNFFLHHPIYPLISLQYLKSLLGFVHSLNMDTQLKIDSEWLAQYLFQLSDLPTLNGTGKWLSRVGFEKGRYSRKFFLKTKYKKLEAKRKFLTFFSPQTIILEWGMNPCVWGKTSDWAGLFTSITSITLPRHYYAFGSSSRVNQCQDT